jgi:large subunit ribosomal protein L17
MITSLFRKERIKTTKAKAFEIRRAAEKMITRAKEDSVHNRRIVSSRLFDEGIVAKLFTDIAPRMKDRNGGYTRIIKLGERKGDAAEIVILELVDYKLDTGDKKAKKKEDKKDDKSK